MCSRILWTPRSSFPTSLWILLHVFPWFHDLFYLGQGRTWGYSFCNQWQNTSEGANNNNKQKRRRREGKATASCKLLVCIWVPSCVPCFHTWTVTRKDVIISTEISHPYQLVCSLSKTFSLHSSCKRQNKLFNNCFGYSTFYFLLLSRRECEEWTVCLYF